jgi:hypothetical protein
LFCFQARQKYANTRSALKSYVDFSTLPSHEEEKELLATTARHQSQARTTKAECLAVAFLFGPEKDRADQKGQLNVIMSELGAAKVDAAKAMQPDIYARIQAILVVK